MSHALVGRADAAHHDHTVAGILSSELSAETPRSEHPNDESWRADALGQSRHTRWVDELRAPLEDRDPESAAATCAAVTRAALRDFAPALILLSPPERRRAQALAAFTLTLFDFASQSGLEGERLAQINRLEFDLEAALGGEPPGQPVFVALANTGPWPPAALDQILSAARRRVGSPRPDGPDDAQREAIALGSALATALNEGSTEDVALLAAGLLRLTDLLGLAEAVRRHRPRLSRSALPDDWIRGAPERRRLDAPVRAECDAIRELLAKLDPHGLTVTQRRSARYLRAAGLRLTAAASRLGGELLEGAPLLGSLSRIGLLLRARIA
jgi:hypothetical protein